MKRSISALVTALLLLVGLAACGGGGGKSASSFCDLVKASQSKFESADFGDSASFSSYTAALAELVAAAPSEIKGDLQTVANAVAGAQKGTVPDQAKVTAAITHLDDYAKNTCHVDLQGTSTDGSSFSSVGSAIGGDSTDSSSDNAAGDTSDFCNGFDLSKLAAIGAGSTNAQDYIGTLRSITPPDAIKDDWAKFIDAIDSLSTASPGDSDSASAAAAIGAAAVPVVTYFQSHCSSSAN